MKKTLLILCVATMLQGVHANDGAYYLTGNQLIPTQKMDIDVRKEILTIQRMQIDEYEDDISVKVHYELDNLGQAQSVIVGFEALPAEGDANSCPENGKHPYMKDFQVKMNGKHLDYQVATVPLDLYTDNPKAFPPSYLKNNRIQDAKIPDDCDTAGLFVYYFTADFKKGKNVIEHQYRFQASGSVDLKYNFDYVLSAINRWGDNKVEDFQLSIDMGDMTEFAINNTFFDNPSDWTLDGKIKAYPTPKWLQYSSYLNDSNMSSTTFSVKTGKIHFKKTNFTPKGELFLYSPQLCFANCYEDLFDARTDDLSLNYLGNLYNSVTDTQKAKLSAFSRKVLRNYPFARHGYVFKNPDIQAYYERQPCYIRDEGYRINMKAFNQFERELIEKLK